MTQDNPQFSSEQFHEGIIFSTELDFTTMQN